MLASSYTPGLYPAAAAVDREANGCGIRKDTMATEWKRTRTAAMVIGLALGVASCATTAQTESLLSQAGFRRLPADTPAKVAHLETLPPHRLVGRTHQGKKYYVYADPEGCKCLYIGSAAQYQGFQRLVQQQQAAAERWETTGVDEAREWEIENAGLQ
jgi:hypothetical protein